MVLYFGKEISSWCSCITGLGQDSHSQLSLTSVSPGLLNLGVRFAFVPAPSTEELMGAEVSIEPQNTSKGILI